MEALRKGPHAVNQRQKWLEWRQSSIGASEAATILGLNPWSSPLKLFSNKIGLTDDGPIASEAAEWGHRLQTAVLQAMTDKSEGKTFSEFEIGLVNPDFPYLHATPDAIVGGAGVIPSLKEPFPELGEAKVTSVTKHWEDGVPAHVQCQVQVQMAVTRSNMVTVGALFNARQFEMWEIERDDEFIHDELLPKVKEFHERLEAGDPPDETTAGDGEVLSLMYPASLSEGSVALTGMFTDLDDELVSVKQALKDMGDKKKELENKLKRAIGEHTSGVLPNGVSYSWKTQVRKAYTVEHPERTTRILRRHK